MSVQSKNLFNFPAQGSYDKDVAAFIVQQKEMMKEMFGEEGPLFKESNSEEVNTGILRGYMEKSFEMLAEDPHYKKILASCVTEEMLVPKTNNIKIIIHTPKSLLNQEGRTGVIYAHGGGAVSGTAEMYKPVTAGLAVETNTVVISVDYRLAPETKCPDNVRDFYQALKFVKENCARWRLNPDRLIISGESGGGYICFGAMVMLAQKQEANIVKAAFPIIPMMSDYFFSDPAL